MKKIIIICLTMTLICVGCMSAYGETEYREGVKEIDLFAMEEEKQTEFIRIEANSDVVPVMSAQDLNFQDESELVSEDYFGEETVKIVSVYANSNSYYEGDFFISTNQLRRTSNVSPFILNQCLYGTEMFGLGYAFKCAEEKYGVNALFLMGLAMHESNGGRSAIARDKNNLFGFMAYDSSPYQSAGTFRSKEDCIDYVARYISKHYLTEGGAYFEGYSIESMNIHYASDPNWARGIKIRIRQLISNMPASQMSLSY